MRLPSPQGECQGGATRAGCKDGGPVELRITRMFRDPVLLHQARKLKRNVMKAPGARRIGLGEGTRALSRRLRCTYAFAAVCAMAALSSTTAVSKISTCTSFGPAPAALAASARGPASLLSLASRSALVSHTVDAVRRPLWRSTLAIVAR